VGAKDTIKQALMTVLAVPDVAASRVVGRASVAALHAGSRDAGHFDAERVTAELWNDEVARPVAGGWPVIEVGTGGPVDVGPLVAAIRVAAGTGSPGSMG
jgi:hypothetical protein